MASADVTVTLTPNVRPVTRLLKVQQLGIEVAQERTRQEDKWGIQHHPDGSSPQRYTGAADEYRAITDQADASGNLTWGDILLEEVFEALAEDPNSPGLRTELIQSAAVIFAWIEDIDSRAAAERTIHDAADDLVRATHG